ncbi:Latrophilin-3, partial [Stegodyphus mimosarum]
MLLEGFHIYLLLVVVFASRRSHSEKYYIFGYGFPMIVVAITATARPMYYGTDGACWLSVEKGTIWAFMGPVACILLVNTAALILAQWKASHISIKDDNTALVMRWLRVTLILFPVLGLTWVFGFLYVGEHFEVAGYLFAIFNSLQGFCIFIFHCVMDKKARNMVVSSFKKKSASVNTGSSGTQRKQKDPHLPLSDKQINGITNDVQNNTSVTNKKSRFSFREKYRNRWRVWHKRWAFCFDLPASDNESQGGQKEHQEIP